MKERLLDIVQSVLLLVIAICLIFGVFKCSDRHTNLATIEQAREAELKYFSYLSELNDEVQRYIDKNSPNSNLRALSLIELCDKYQVDLKFVLAQGKIESNFGTAGLAIKTNSVWNVGAFDGLESDSIDKKFKYSHPNESIEPYLKLLKERYLVNRSEMSLMLEYVDINGNRYATEPTYEKRLHSIYDAILVNTTIDSLQMMVRHYKIECGR